MCLAVDGSDALGLMAVDGVHDLLVVGLGLADAHKSIFDVLTHLLDSRA